MSFPLYDGHGNQVSSLQRSGAGYSVGALGFTDPWGVRYGGRTDGTAKYCANLGHPTDYETGLVYMRARYYEAWTGRFISEDPARDGWNWYAYCSNAPTLGTDFSGKSASFVFSVFLAGFCSVLITAAAQRGALSAQEALLSFYFGCSVGFASAIGGIAAEAASDAGWSLVASYATGMSVSGITNCAAMLFIDAITSADFSLGDYFLQFFSGAIGGGCNVGGVTPIEDVASGAAASALQAAAQTYLRECRQ